MICEGCQREVREVQRDAGADGRGGYESVIAMKDEVSVRELIHKLYAASERMSKKNQHRALILHSMSALMQLSNQLGEMHERAAAVEQKADDKRVELVTLQ